MSAARRKGVRRGHPPASVDGVAKRGAHDAASGIASAIGGGVGAAPRTAGDEEAFRSHIGRASTSDRGEEDAVDRLVRATDGRQEGIEGKGASFRGVPLAGSCQSSVEAAIAAATAAGSLERAATSATAGTGRGWFWGAPA